MTGPTSLLAIGFVNPVFLGGLGLVALPILIHLLSRRQYRPINWAAMRFLLEAEKENRRRRRFEQWLLVALRCLALALLALLVSRPFIEPGLAAALLGGRGHVPRVILIDDSASLAYRTGTTQDFTLLRDAAQRLLDWLHGGAAGDPVSVYLTSQPDGPLAEIPRLTASTLNDLRERVGKLRVTNLSARPRLALRKIAEQLLTRSQQAQADVYVLSDFQRSEWFASDENTASVFEPLNEVSADQLRVVLIAAASAGRDNVALLAAQLERPQAIAGQPAVIHATVANYARRPLRNVRLQVDADGAPLPPVTLASIAAGETRTTSAEVTFSDEGYRTLGVAVSSVDGLPADDTRRLVVPVRRALRLCLVNGEPATDPVRDEVYFLRSALMPAGPFSSGIETQEIDPSEIEAVALERFDCVLLCNVAAPSQSAVAALERYVRAGGGLVFFLGDQVGDPDEYNRAFYAGGDSLLPLPLRELREHKPQRSDGGDAVRQPYGVGMVRTGEHSVTAMLPEAGAEAAETVQVRAYYRCAMPVETLAESAASERPEATTLAQFTDDVHSSAIIERPLGRGRTLLFTSTIDLDWNDWPRALDGSYVVTLLELVQHASRRSEEPLSFTAGDALRLAVLPEEYEPVAVFRSPGTSDEPAVEARAQDVGAAVGAAVTLEGPVATQLGTYTAELSPRGGGIEQRRLAVNLDARESTLASASPHELDIALGRVPHEYIRASEAFQRDDAGARHEVWPVILLALVMTLFIEQALACWFGMPPRSADLRPGVVRRVQSMRAWLRGSFLGRRLT